MNKIFNNKVFMVFIFLALFVLSLSCSSFAADDTNEYKVYMPCLSKDITVSLDKRYFDNNYYFITAHPSQCSVFIVSSQYPLGYHKNDDGGIVWGYKGNTSYSCIDLIENGSKYVSKFEYGNEFISSHKFSSDKYAGYGGGICGDIVSANYDVYNFDASSDTITNDVVFHVAPARVEPLKEITQVEEIQPAITKIVGLVLPACLIIFGTLLVLYLIKSKNLLQV